MENAVVSEQDIRNKMLADSKAFLRCLTIALAETTNPRLREIWTRHLNTAIDEHFQIADLVVNQTYSANPDPVSMIKKDVSVRLNL